MTREELAKKKVLFCDLDGTLIKTYSGNTFPQGVWDVELKLDIWSKIVDLFPNLKALYIVSNQGGIGHGYVNKDSFHNKINWICSSLEDWFELKAGFIPMISARICTSNDPDCPNKKPNPGMLERAINLHLKNIGVVCKEEMIMLGDASGYPGDFSDSDKVCAQNFGIDYVDVRDFLKL